MTISLALSYPLLAHVASVRDSPELTLASVAVLGAAVLGPPLLAGRRWAYVAAPLSILVVAALSRHDAVAPVLYAPPVLLNAGLAWLFGHTLARGSTPLIERLVRLLQPPGVPLEGGVIRYAQNLTRAWTVLFVALGAASLALAVLATRETWSLFANAINYAIVAAFFLLEYAWRRRRFSGQPYRNFAHFLQRAAEVAPALAASLRDRAPATFVVPVEHPAFAGHFPGRPLLPGVVVLERVIDEAQRLVGASTHVLEVPRVKFLAALVPGDRATIRLRQESGVVHFEVLRSGQRIAQGLVSFGHEKTPG